MVFERIHYTWYSIWANPFSQLVEQEENKYQFLHKYFSNFQEYELNNWLASKTANGSIDLDGGCQLVVDFSVSNQETEVFM